MKTPMEYLTASLYLPCDDILPFPWPGRLRLLDLGPLTSLNFESRCFDSSVVTCLTKGTSFLSRDSFCVFSQYFVGTYLTLHIVALF